MATSATELGKLVIRLTADAAEFTRTLDKAEKDLRQTTGAIVADAKKITAEGNRALAEAARITAAYKGPYDVYKESILKLRGHLNAGRISQETFNAAAREAGEIMRTTTNPALGIINRTLAQAKIRTDALRTAEERHLIERAKIDKLYKMGMISLTTYNRGMARATEGIKAARDAEYGFLKELKITKDTAPQAAKAIDDWRVSMMRLLVQVRMGKLSVEQYNEVVKQTGQRVLPAVQAAQDAYNKEVEEARQVTQALLTPTQQYQQKLTQLNRLHKAGLISNQTYAAGLASIKTQAVALGPVLTHVHQAMSRVAATAMVAGTRISMALTAPVVGLSIVGVREFAKFDDAMTRTEAISETMTKSIRAEMEATALALSNRGVFSSTQLAESYYHLAAAGLEARAALESVAVVQKFAMAGTLQLDKATQLLVETQTVLGKRSKDAVENARQMEEVADVITKAGNISTASLEEFSRALVTKSGAAIRLLGKEMEEGVAVLAALAAQGTKAELAGEQLYIMLRDVQSAALKNKETWKALGVEGFDPVTGEMKHVADIVEDLEGLLAGMSDEQRKATMLTLGFTDRSVAATTTLLGMSDAIREYEKQLQNASGETDRIAKIMGTSFANSLKTFRNVVLNAAMAVGKILAPVITKLTEVIRTGLDWWNSLGAGQQKVVVAIMAIAAAIGPMIIGFGMALGVVSSVVGIIASLVTLGGPAVAIIAAIGGGIVTMTMYFTALGAAVVGFLYWIYGSEGFVAAWQAVSTAVSQFATYALGFLGNFSTNMGILVGWIQDNWVTMFTDLGGVVAAFAANMVGNFGTLLRTGARLFMAFIGYVGGLFYNGFAIDMVAAVYKGLSLAAQAFQAFALKAWETIVNVFQGRKVEWGDFLGQMGQDFAGAARSGDFLGTAKNIIKDEMGNIKVFEGFQSSIKEAPKFVFDEAKKVGQAVTKGIEAGTADTAAGLQPQRTQAEVAALLASLSEESQEAAENVEKLTNKLKEQVATQGMSAHQITAWKLAQAHAQGLVSDEALAEANAMSANATATKEAAKEAEKAARIMERAEKAFETAAAKRLSPAEKLKKEQTDLKAMLDKGLISLEAYNWELAEAEKDFKKEFKVNFKVTGIEAVEAGTAEATARLMQFRALQPDKPVQRDVAGLSLDGKSHVPLGPYVLPKPTGPKRTTGGDVIENLLERIATGIADLVNKEPIEAIPVEPVGLGVGG